MKPQEKLVSLNDYVAKLKGRLTSPVSEKHKDHPEAFKAYLNLEITKANRTIEELKLKVNNK